MTETDALFSGHRLPAERRQGNPAGQSPCAVQRGISSNAMVWNETKGNAPGSCHVPVLGLRWEVVSKVAVDRAALYETDQGASTALSGGARTSACPSDGSIGVCTCRWACVGAA